MPLRWSWGGCTGAALATLPLCHDWTGVERAEEEGRNERKRRAKEEKKKKRKKTERERKK
jgi:hypothetical protein